MFDKGDIIHIKGTTYTVLSTREKATEADSGTIFIVTDTEVATLQRDDGDSEDN